MAQVEDETAFGDLARDARDSGWEGDTPESLREDIEAQGIGVEVEAALATLDRAIDEFNKP